MKIGKVLASFAILISFAAPVSAIEKQECVDYLTEHEFQSDECCLAFPKDFPGCDTVFKSGGMDYGLRALRHEVSRGEGIGVIVDEEVSVIRTILSWIKFFLVLAGVLVFAGFVWAGFLYLSAFAREGNVEQAKKTMTYTALGVVLILFSYVITQLLIEVQWD